MSLLWDKIHTYCTCQDIIPIIWPGESHTATTMLVLSMNSVVPKLFLTIINTILTRWIRVMWKSHHEKVWLSGGDEKKTKKTEAINGQCS